MICDGCLFKVRHEGKSFLSADEVNVNLKLELKINSNEVHHFTPKIIFIFTTLVF